MLLPGPVVGVVHLAPLPGSPRFGGDVSAVTRAAVGDAVALASGGVHAVLVENFGDAPFFKEDLPPETVAAMTVCVSAVAREIPLPLGINALRNDAHAALGIAAATGASFIRVNVLSGAAITDQGLIEGRAAETLRVRKNLAPDVAILADVHVKHARPLGGGDLLQDARDTWERGGADGLILTGPGTSTPADPGQLEILHDALSGCPLYVGSGVQTDTVAATLERAAGVIVGTAFKVDGHVRNPVDPESVRAFMQEVPR